MRKNNQGGGDPDPPAKCVEVQNPNASRETRPNPGRGDSAMDNRDAQYREGTKEEIQRYKKALRKFYHGTAEEAEDEEGMCLLNLSTQSGNWAVEVPRKGEITWKEMTEEEIQMFQKSDLTEWESLEKEFKAVKVWTGEAAEKLRRSHPDRIMTARVVRRKKPMPGLHQFKAKSRFCVHRPQRSRRWNVQNVRPHAHYGGPTHGVSDHRELQHEAALRGREGGVRTS